MADIRSLDLNLLRVFDALMDERNVTRAAARLALTQPAVSGLLTRLRDSFDDPLFVRAPRGVVPTERALALAAPIKQVLADIDALLHPAAFDPASASLTVTLAATDYALRAIVVPLLEALRVRAPRLRVAVRTIDDATVQAQLERGEVDLALMTPDSAPVGLHARRLFDERYVCALRDGHPAAAASALSLDSFCTMDHALVSLSGDPFRGATDTALAALGRERRVVLSVESFLLLPEVLRRSDLIAVLPSRLADAQPGLRIFEPPLAIPGFTKVAVWHERSHRSTAHQWFRRLLVEVCGDSSDRTDMLGASEDRGRNGA